MGKSIGMKDIALSLGISVDAVSKALRNTDDISLATKEKVRAKAVELGYVKDRAAVARPLFTSSSGSYRPSSV